MNISDRQKKRIFFDLHLPIYIAQQRFHGGIDNAVFIIVIAMSGTRSSTRTYQDMYYILPLSTDVMSSEYVVYALYIDDYVP